MDQNSGSHAAVVALVAQRWLVPMTYKAIFNRCTSWSAAGLAKDFPLSQAVIGGIVHDILPRKQSSQDTELRFCVCRQAFQQLQRTLNHRPLPLS